MCQIVKNSFLAAFFLLICLAPARGFSFGNDLRIALPRPSTTGNLSVEEALQARKSIRSYSKEPLLLSEISQLLWAAQGITRKDGKRTAPSAGALYPLEIYIVSGQVHGLDSGIYRYQADRHTLEPVLSGMRQKELATAALQQDSIIHSSAVIVVAGVYRRTAKKYGGRAERYVHIETGHAAQNIFLQATSLGLSTVVIGAFDDDAVKRVLGMPQNETPLLLMPLGK
ncbi:MAG: SagB/ThcOx family dehydrogenase [Desulfobulbaceae bacterium]|uniref:SagB/ThcOx family dehydrogenase n=1 Tax=Candidatus Desulfobia pelagia TaxID=2841692 RepID=A0A8J6NEB0_9BACT|nr:SagB/ThcOx family dehydrogenase [Candidatus Desulfobia pelagia]